ncbi:glycoside hydrolase family 27 protein [Carboxylicivirga sp. A043]|uniref:glycoside hydrolase family 27 protein n=1 Tax=Carboxylicivirga litoralis TaxID=2816963 RepID=UPI0021CB4C24|nr:glycoside hydrolase family 27 protein [Carboxylicivirga sp. A043]MCU4157828.1 glycoside hydrolase family 27 protein [Carboxylicivirga sp. A043]
MNKLLWIAVSTLLLLAGCAQKNDRESISEPVSKPLTPLMGWASWNQYRVKISEDIIKAQADALVESGLKEAGYNFINIDDGFFGGRDAQGNIIPHSTRFPNGMKAVADYIHSKGLKAGIYSDAGINTCASYWDKDTIGVGMGLYGHDRQDLTLMLKDWGYDFIKVDWCGGQWLDLDEQTRYTEIANLINEIKPGTVYNICRWQFPGKWATSIADSWRISGDIANKFSSILQIIDINAELWRYASPGHFNDMDMLQVGRGMSYEEDKTHFSMWCMMNSPLMAGNDLSSMSQQTLDILTNKEVIALNQDPLAYQARRIIDYGDLEVWGKPLGSTMSGEVAVALLNRSETLQPIEFKLEDIGILASKGYTYRDLWTSQSSDSLQDENLCFDVPSHGVVVLRIKGQSKPYNVYQYK